MDSLGFSFLVFCFLFVWFWFFACLLEMVLLVAQTHLTLSVLLPQPSGLCVNTPRRVSFLVARLQAWLLPLDLIPTGPETLCGRQIRHMVEDFEAV